MIKGLIFVCDKEFNVENIPFNTFEDDSASFISKPFNQLVIQDELFKTNSFLEMLRSDGAVFNWTINFNFKDVTEPLIFSGSKFIDNYIILGLKTNDDLPFLYQELMRINNEQANYIRNVVKEKFIRPSAEFKEEETYDELSRLNNELVNLQRELFKKNTELAKLNLLKNRFLGMAAHDLRNPLAAILSQSEFLIEELEDKIPVEEMDFLKSILKSSFFMLSLVEDLLDVSKIETGNLNLKKKDVDFIPFLHEIVKLNNILAKKKNIQIISDEKIDSLIIPFDQYKITQVINNLLTNAVKFSHPDSEIILKIILDDDFLKISIKDTGTGIITADLQEIFTPFNKATSKGTAGEKSTGLGLSICKKIVEGHNGKIWVESEVDKGSTFSFSLPTNG